MVLATFKNTEDVETYETLHWYFKKASPHKKKGFPKARLVKTFFRSIYIALSKEPDKDLYTMILSMCLAAAGDNEEAKQEILELCSK